MILITKRVRFCYRLPGDDFLRSGALAPRVYLDIELPIRGRDAGGAAIVETLVGVDENVAVRVPLADDEWREPFVNSNH